MQIATSPYRLFLFLPALLILALVMGCGTSSEPAQSGIPAPVSGSAVSLGSHVGDRIKPFALRLVDGSTVTSNDLLDQNRPTFLFFFKKG